MATEQALREQNQLLRKQLEDMNIQMQAIMAQLQGNKIPQSSQVSQEPLPNLEIANAEAVVLVETAQQKNKRVIDYEALQNYQSVCYPQPSFTSKAVIQAPQQQQAPVQQMKNLRYPPLPVPQTRIYQQLVAKRMISSMPAHPRVPPFPAWYHPNTHCAYHGVVPGHSTEDCVRLRQRIYEMINAGSIKLSPFQNVAPKIN
jgi:hypothetical protein